MQGGLAIVAVSALAITLVSSVAERRRSNRIDLESVGFVPWQLISVLGTIVALFALALAIKFG